MDLALPIIVAVLVVVYGFVSLQQTDSVEAELKRKGYSAEASWHLSRRLHPWTARRVIALLPEQHEPLSPSGQLTERERQLNEREQALDARELELLERIREFERREQRH